MTTQLFFLAATEIFSKVIWYLLLVIYCLKYWYYSLSVSSCDIHTIFEQAVHRFTSMKLHSPLVHPWLHFSSCLLKGHTVGNEWFWRQASKFTLLATLSPKLLCKNRKWLFFGSWCIMFVKMIFNILCYTVQYTTCRFFWSLRTLKLDHLSSNSICCHVSCKSSHSFM